MLAARSMKRGVSRRLKGIRLGWRERHARNKVHLVAPSQIRFISLQTFMAPDQGKVIAGDWDELSRPLDDADHAKTNVGHAPPDNQSVVSVNIGRHGDLLLNDERELLGVVRSRRLDKIPVTIVVRHPQWMEFREEVRRDPRGPYSPLLHPDLEWRIAETGHDRFELIQRALIANRGSMLEIGCNWGYFTQRFEEIGFRCTAVEYDPRRYYFLQKLKRAGNYSYEAVNASIFEYVTEPRAYDVVLALSILHHFIKTKEGVGELASMLQRLRTSEMFFMPTRPDEKQMVGSYWNPTEDEFTKFVMNHTGLRKSVCLGRGGRAETRRALYHLTA